MLAKLVEMKHLMEPEDHKELRHVRSFEGRGEGAASWWSQMAFSWITELLVKGKEQQLADTDLFPLLEEDTTYNSGERLYEAWNQQKDLDGTSVEPSLFKALKQVSIPDKNPKYTEGVSPLSQRHTGPAGVHTQPWVWTPNWFVSSSGICACSNTLCLPAAPDLGLRFCRLRLLETCQ